jgi:mono/diheme cytochrome c family protein
VRLQGFWLYVAVFLLIYLFLRFGFGYLSQAIVGASNPLPVPSRLLSMYLALALIALVVQITVNDKSMREFTEPVVDLLTGNGEAGGLGRSPLRLAVLAIPPLLVGWAVYQQLVPKVASAATSRQQHPVLPAQYAELENPFRASEETEQAAVAEGIILYERNCRTCHGTPAHGRGPSARAFRPRPIGFTDPGTIDTVIEPYLVWRIEEGGIGLPAGSTPWHSAMPPWKAELERDDIWKIIMAEFQIAEKEPRVPESHE